MAEFGWLLYVLLAALLIYFWSRRRGAFAELQALDAGQGLTKTPSPALPFKVGGRCEIGQTGATIPVHPAFKLHLLKINMIQMRSGPDGA